MNILVVTKAAWDDRLASGNTLSNFFEDWENVDFHVSIQELQSLITKYVRNIMLFLLSQ